MVSKRWLKRTAGAVVLVVVIRTAWLVGEREWVRAAGEKDYAAAVAETEETDPDWRWEALTAKRRRPPDGKNGAELVPRVQQLAPPGWGTQLQSKEWEPLLSGPSNCRYPDAVVEEARREVAAAGEAIRLAREFKDRPWGHREIHLTPDYISTPLTETQGTRLAAALLRWDVAAAVEDADTNRAADGLLAMLNASRSVGDEPTSISQLVRYATRREAGFVVERVLGHVEFTEEQLATLQSAWAADTEEPLYLYGVRGERAGFDVLVGNLINGTVTPDGLSGTNDGDSPMGHFGWWLFRARLAKNRAFALRWFNEAVAIGRLPLHEQSDMRKLLEGAQEGRHGPAAGTAPPPGRPLGGRGTPAECGRGAVRGRRPRRGAIPHPARPLAEGTGRASRRVACRRRAPRPVRRPATPLPAPRRRLRDLFDRPGQDGRRREPGARRSAPARDRLRIPAVEPGAPPPAASATRPTGPGDQAVSDAPPSGPPRSAPPVKKPRRRRRWLKRFLIAVVGLLVLAALTLLGSHEYYRIMGNRELARVTAELDAEEPGWRIEELQAAHEARLPPAGPNSAEVTRATMDALSAVWDRPAEPAADPENPFPPVGRVNQVPAPEWHNQPVSNHLPAAEQLTELTERLQPLTPAVQTARRLVSLPHGGSRLTLPVLPFVHTPNQVRFALITARLLRCEADRAAAGGKPDDALETCLASLNAGRSLGEEPLTQSQLMRMAIGRDVARTSVQILAWGQPTDAPLARLQAELTAESREPFPVRLARSERAVVHKSFEDARAGLVRAEFDARREANPSGRNLSTISEDARWGIAEMIFEPKGGSLDRVIFWWHGRATAGDQAMYLRFMNRLVKIAQLPPVEWIAAAEQFDQDVRSLRQNIPTLVRYLWTVQMGDTALALVRAATDFHMELTCAATGITCERFRLARGRWPATLDEIPRELLPEVPTDWYDGQPLRYHRLADGVVVYSVGRDRRDDGGDLVVRYGADRAQDLGVRLWDPERRGLPPRPEPAQPEPEIKP
jgi:hypothetical protein